MTATRNGYLPGIFTVTDVTNTPEDGLRCRFVARERTNFKPHGRQGSWFAKIGREHLPCLKQNHRTGVTEYHDPYCYDPNTSKEAEYIDAVRRGRVLVADYNTAEDA